ncbi:hypothetical protein [Ichthyobacterium seriolicida]|uniref:Uncharacterized protein n=1 Tax=Ichthyobacterium seriolicida TaxID=242600 RepID=A0A1J1E6F3_9FLAO|nr:hypothetical protein [Ichthyobacterium seriolicida]BAV94902.1 hypothetical protein JBKA6_0889 [Ichthyobacterium seriolicida]
MKDENHRNRASYYDRSKEGKTTVDKVPKRNKTYDNVGEYVDYEEVEK